jgi:hypothetical protein
VYDYAVSTGRRYQYFVAQQNSSTAFPAWHGSETVSPCWWEWHLIEAQNDGEYGVYKPVQTFSFALNVASGNDGNGAAPGVYNNFTPYPVVMRDVTNRHSGTLSGLIGDISSPGEYTDRNEIRDALRNLSGTKNTLFLRSRRGDLFKVAVSGEISTAVDDNSPKQQITASIPWVEIGTPDGSIVTYGYRMIDPWDYFVSPSDIVQTTSEMSAQQKKQTMENLGAVDQTLFPERVKTALLACLEHAAWATEQGRECCDAVEDALYPVEQG